MPSRFWLVSVPLHGTKDATWKELQEKLKKVSTETTAYKLNVPELRVGTLDSLLELSDDLVKANAFVEGVTSKIRRQIEDLDRVLGGQPSTLAVDGVPVETYITRFAWDEAKHPLMNPLHETVDTIHESVSKLEEDLKVRVSEYNTVKSQLSAINRKAGGSMLVRDLSQIVKQEDIVSSEHLTTLLVVVSKFSEKEWLSSYEKFTTFVVPRSSKKIIEDNDYALFTVTLFRKVIDTFKVKAREQGFQVREYEHDPEGFQKRQGEQTRLTSDQESMRSALHQWCNVSYGEVFSSWMHVCVIRVFCESILRYGLPPAFLASALAPILRDEKKVRTILEGFCTSASSAYWKSGETENTGADSDLHPYVSFTLNLAS